MRFELASGMAKEARNTGKEQVEMAKHVATEHARIVSLCRGALARDCYPHAERHSPLTDAGRRVAVSLLELESVPITSAPHNFLGSSSTRRSLRRIDSILLRSVALCEVYNDPLYRDARGRTRRAVDKLAQQQMQTNQSSG